jgi:hypothetical protein
MHSTLMTAPARPVPVRTAPARPLPPGVDGDRAAAIAVTWYGGLVAGYVVAALTLPVGPVRHLMLTVGACVGVALLLCAVLISAVVICARAGQARSAAVLGAQAAWTGLAGALLFLGAAAVLYNG